MAATPEFNPSPFGIVSLKNTEPIFVPAEASQEDLARIWQSTEMSGIPSADSLVLRPLRAALTLANKALGSIIRR